MAGLLEYYYWGREKSTSEMSSRMSENNSSIHNIEKNVPNIACKMSLEFYMLFSWFRLSVFSSSIGLYFICTLKVDLF